MKTPTMHRPAIGGYAVIEFSGNDLFDAQQLLGVAPTKSAARKVADGRAWSWKAGHQQLLKRLKRDGHEYEPERDTTRYAELRTLSPGLYQEVAGRMEAATRRNKWPGNYEWTEIVNPAEVGRLTDMLAGGGGPYYEVGKINKIKVLCTHREIDERDAWREAWHDLRAFEATQTFERDDLVYFLADDIRRGFKFAGVEVGDGDKLDRRIARAEARALKRSEERLPIPGF